MKTSFPKPLIALIVAGFLGIGLFSYLSSCTSACNCETIDRKAKDGEMLYKICKYVVDNKIDIEPAKPCEFKIRKTKDDTLNWKHILRITLTCCDMGDQAIVDKKTNEVIGYWQSDK